MQQYNNRNQSLGNNNYMIQQNPLQQSFLTSQSEILRKNAQNILSQSQQNINMNNNNLLNSQKYGLNNINNSSGNYNNHQNKQYLFNERQNDYHNNINIQSNQIQSREDEIRNLDRMNKINNQLYRKQHIDSTNQVRNAQHHLQSYQPSNNNRRQNSALIHPTFNTIPHTINNNNDNVNNNLSHLPDKRIAMNLYDQQNRLKSSNSSNNNSQINLDKRPSSNNIMPSFNQMNNNKNNNININPYNIPQFNSMPFISMNKKKKNYDSDSDDDEEIEQRKEYKQVSTAITKQNEIMMNLLSKLNQPENTNNNYYKKPDDEIERYSRLSKRMLELKYPPLPNYQHIPTQIIQPQPYGYDSNNMVVQMMYQQQMMQAFMYSQLLNNANKQNQKNDQMSALDMMRQQQREQNLENMIKQLIMQKGGNMEELQKKLDMLSGYQPPIEQKKNLPKQPESEDDDDDDDDDDEDEDDEVDEEALKAQQEKERKAKLRLEAIKKVRRMWHRNAFAFKFLNNLRKNEERNKAESQENLPYMQSISLKNGLLWSLVACEKAFSVMRSKPKENLDIINDVDKLKSSVLDERITNICNLTQFILDGILEHTNHIPTEIPKFCAIYFQEKSYLPEGVISQLEIDRLEFNQNFGYLVNVSKEQRQMLIGVYFLVKIIILAVLAHPWQYQLNDTKLKEEPITKTKLLLISSIIYHIFIEHVKKSLNPIPNNISNLPIKMKPQPMQQTLIHELGNKTQAENGTRYNIVTGLIDFNSLLVIWTQKSDWRNQMLEKIKLILASIDDQAKIISDEADELERLDNIQNAQDLQNYLPNSIKKSTFATKILPGVPVEDQKHLIKRNSQQNLPSQQNGGSNV